MMLDSLCVHDIMITNMLITKSNFDVKRSPFFLRSFKMLLGGECIKLFCNYTNLTSANLNSLAELMHLNEYSPTAVNSQNHNWINCKIF